MSDAKPDVMQSFFAVIAICAVLIAIFYASFAMPPYFIGDMSWYMVKGIYDLGIILSLGILSLVSSIMYHARAGP
ncbi:MAG: hypothetical protein ACFFF4_18420 [Candidatus Thorarchaeota archaeon]